MSLQILFLFIFDCIFLNNNKCSVIIPVNYTWPRSTGFSFLTKIFSKAWSCHACSLYICYLILILISERTLLIPGEVLSPPKLFFSVLTCLSVLQARGEDQDPGEKGERPDRGELHGAELGSLAAGQSICLFLLPLSLVWFSFNQHNLHFSLFLFRNIFWMKELSATATVGSMHGWNCIIRDLETVEDRFWTLLAFVMHCTVLRISLKQGCWHYSRK